MVKDEGLFSIVTGISTALSLIAFLAVVILLILRKHWGNKTDLIKNLIESAREEDRAEIINNFIDSTELPSTRFNGTKMTKDRAYKIAEKQLDLKRSYYNNRLMLTAFLAVIFGAVATIAIIAPPRKDQVTAPEINNPSEMTSKTRQEKTNESFNGKGSTQRALNQDSGKAPITNKSLPSSPSNNDEDKKAEIRDSRDANDERESPEEKKQQKNPEIKEARTDKGKSQDRRVPVSYLEIDSHQGEKCSHKCFIFTNEHGKTTPYEVVYNPSGPETLPYGAMSTAGLKGYKPIAVRYDQESGRERIEFTKIAGARFQFLFLIKDKGKNNNESWHVFGDKGVKHPQDKPALQTRGTGFNGQDLAINAILERGYKKFARVNQLKTYSNKHIETLIFYREEMRDPPPPSQKVSNLACGLKITSVLAKRTHLNNADIKLAIVASWKAEGSNSESIKSSEGAFYLMNHRIIRWFYGKSESEVQPPDNTIEFAPSFLNEKFRKLSIHFRVIVQSLDNEGKSQEVSATPIVIDIGDLLQAPENFKLRTREFSAEGYDVRIRLSRSF